MSLGEKVAEIVSELKKEAAGLQKLKKLENVLGKTHPKVKAQKAYREKMGPQRKQDKEMWEQYRRDHGAGGWGPFPGK